MQQRRAARTFLGFHYLDHLAGIGLQLLPAEVLGKVHPGRVLNGLGELVDS